MADIWEYLEYTCWEVVGSTGQNIRTSPTKISQIVESLHKVLSDLGVGEVIFEDSSSSPDFLSIRGASHVDILNALSLDKWEPVTELNKVTVVFRRLVKAEASNSPKAD